MSHSVFADLPPEIPDDFVIPKAVKEKRCLGCVRHAYGAPHKCPVGRCQVYEDAIIEELNRRKADASPTP